MLIGMSDDRLLYSQPQLWRPGATVRACGPSLLHAGRWGLTGAEALRAFVRAVDGRVREIPLAPGDHCFVDNQTVVHGRRSPHATTAPTAG